ncbi:uncharacterized protein RHO17_003495 [Thomomys bottae]
MSAYKEEDPGFRDQERADSDVSRESRQIILHMLPLDEANDDIDGAAALLVSQAVARAISEEECEQEEVWPGVEEMWPAEEIWPDVEEAWPGVEEVWPDVEEGWYVWRAEQEDDNEEGQEDDDDERDYSNEELDEEQGDQGNFGIEY